MNFVLLFLLICVCGLNVHAQRCEEKNGAKGKGDCNYSGLGGDCIGGCGNLNQKKLITLIIRIFSLYAYMLNLIFFQS